MFVKFFFAGRTREAFCHIHTILDIYSGLLSTMMTMNANLFTSVHSGTLDNGKSTTFAKPQALAFVNGYTAESTGTDFTYFMVIAFPGCSQAYGNVWRSGANISSSQGYGSVYVTLSSDGLKLTVPSGRYGSSSYFSFGS